MKYLKAIVHVITVKYGYESTYEELKYKYKYNIRDIILFPSWFVLFSVTKSVGIYHQYRINNQREK